MIRLANNTYFGFTLVDLPSYAWNVLVGLNKVTAGYLLLATGLALIIITSRKKEGWIQQYSREEAS